MACLFGCTWCIQVCIRPQWTRHMQSQPLHRPRCLPLWYCCHCRCPVVLMGLAHHPFVCPIELQSSLLAWLASHLQNNQAGGFLQFGAHTCSKCKSSTLAYQQQLLLILVIPTRLKMLLVMASCKDYDNHLDWTVSQKACWGNKGDHCPASAKRKEGIVFNKFKEHRDPAFLPLNTYKVNSWSEIADHDAIIGCRLNMEMRASSWSSAFSTFLNLPIKVTLAQVGSCKGRSKGFTGFTKQSHHSQRKAARPKKQLKNFKFAWTGAHFISRYNAAFSE